MFRMTEEDQEYARMQERYDEEWRTLTMIVVISILAINPPHPHPAFSNQQWQLIINIQIPKLLQRIRRIRELHDESCFSLDIFMYG